MSDPKPRTAVVIVRRVLPSSVLAEPSSGLGLGRGAFLSSRPTEGHESREALRDVLREVVAGPGQFLRVFYVHRDGAFIDPENVMLYKVCAAALVLAARIKIER